MVQQPGVVEKIRRSYRIVDLVFGPHLIWRFPEFLWRVMTERGRVFETQESRSEIAEGLPILRAGAYTAWVSVMYGCTNFCSFCIVPYVRGRERSRRPEEILREVRSLAENGCREITLLGQNVNSYGKDLGLGMDFAALLEAVNAVPGDFLIRFMTSHPKDASVRLFDAMAPRKRSRASSTCPFRREITASCAR
jgi:tRNA-2-methylthio-N6-dimethylallyladenosine synthase